MAVKPIDRVCADIKSGKATADDVNQIVKAITTAAAVGIVGTRWVVDCLGVKAREDDLLVDEAWRIEETVNLDWRNIDPLESAKDFRAILLVLLQSRLGLSEEEAAEKLATLTVVDAAAGIRREWFDNQDDEGGVPLASGASATTS